MRPRTVSTLAALAALLTGYYWLFERDAAPWVTPTGAVFPRLQFADVEEVELAPGAFARAAGVPSDPILIRKVKDERGSWWEIVEPRVPANQPRVESIVWSLVELQRIHDVPAGGAAAVFAPEGPEVTVRFRTSQGEEHRLEVGRDHPDPALDLVHVRLDGEGLFLTRKAFHKNLNSRLDDLRSRSLIPIPRAEAVRLEVTGDPAIKKAIRRAEAGEDWRFEEPDLAPAGREAMALVLDELNAWKVETFVRDGPGDLAAFGLDPPRAVVALTDHRKKRVAVEVGGEAPEAGRLYVKWAGQPMVMTASEAPVKPLLRPAEILYSQFVLQLGASRIVEVEVAPVAGAGFTLRRTRSPPPPPVNPRSRTIPAESEEEAWQVEEAGGARYPGDVKRIHTLAGELAHLPVKKYIPARPEAGPFNGQAQPALEIRIRTDSGPGAALSLGRPVDPGEERQSIAYVTAEGEQFVFQVITRLLDELPRGGVRFRDRFIPAPSPSDVYSLEVTRRTPSGERQWSLGRVAEVWRLPDDGKLKASRPPDRDLVEAVVRRLGREVLSAIEWMPAGTDLASRELGEDSFRTRIHVRARGEKPYSQRLYLGAPSGVEGAEGARWARIDLPELKDLPFLLPLEVDQKINELVEHLEGITTREE